MRVHVYVHVCVRVFLRVDGCMCTCVCVRVSLRVDVWNCLNYIKPTKDSAHTDMLFSLSITHIHSHMHPQINNTQ